MVSTAGAIVITIVVLLIAAAVGWIVFTQMRARRLGVRTHIRPYRQASLSPITRRGRWRELLHY